MKYGDKIKDIQTVMDAYKLTFDKSEYPIERLIKYHKKLISAYIDEYIPGIFFSIQILIGPMSLSDEGIDKVKMLAQITFENDTTYSIHINNWKWVTNKEEDDGKKKRS
jgi:hypothetical protein